MSAEVPLGLVLRPDAPLRAVGAVLLGAAPLAAPGVGEVAASIALVALDVALGVL